MTYALMLIGFFLITAAVFSSGDLLKQARVMKKQALVLRSQTADLIVKSDRLVALADNPLPAFEYSYRRVYESLKTLESFYDLKMNFKVDGLQESGTLVEAVKASEWDGIGRIPLKVDFQDLSGLDEILSIYAVLTQLQRQNPLQITSIQQVGKQLEVRMQLFGKGGAV